jgi:molybdate-binding protein/DNA-binding XRE family transcriptional regulator
MNVTIMTNPIPVRKLVTARSPAYADRIMAESPPLENHVRDHRMRLGWSQEALARRAGISRAGLSAIETGRLVPSTSAALALAAALGCRVEDLFRLPSAPRADLSWAWPPSRMPSRFWIAEVGGRARAYPAEPTPLGALPHDGVARGEALIPHSEADPKATLVIASCDPAVGLLAAELSRSASLRLIVLPRSSRAALALLGQGLVHAAGIHLSATSDDGGNAAAVKEVLGPGYSLLRVARWEEGLVLAPGSRIATVRAAVGSDLRWVGREVGSGARQCLDEVLDGRRPPRRLAYDHRGVAEAVRCGWADVGVCVRLVSEEAGLEFLGVREEAYDLCIPDSAKDDPRIVALIQAVRSTTYRRLLGEQPGYATPETGELQRVR